MFKGLVVVVLMLNMPIALAQYKVSNKSASVGFSAEHAGMAFSGVFEKWQADISLPNQATDSGFIKAQFDVRTAKTGDIVYDETLPEGDWFDVKNHPSGFFESTSMRKTSQGYEVEGKLTLRGKTLATSFTLEKKGKRLVTKFDIDRLAYGIGVESDPDAEWVSQFIEMTVDIPAS